LAAAAAAVAFSPPAQAAATRAPVASTLADRAVHSLGSLGGLKDPVVFRMGTTSFRTIHETFCNELKHSCYDDENSQE